MSNKDSSSDALVWGEEKATGGRVEATHIPTVDHVGNINAHKS